MKGVTLKMNSEETIVKQGLAVVERFSVNEEQAQHENMLLLFSRQPHWMHITSGNFTKLIVNGSLMMSDTQMERITNAEFIREAKGDVFIAGLGIGLIIENLKPKLVTGEVTRIHVVEKYQDVIDLISPTYSDIPQLTIECADIFEREVPKDEKWDTIYFDIWPTISADNWEEMKKLKAKYRKTRREGKQSYMSCWMEKFVQKIYYENSII